VDFADAGAAALAAIAAFDALGVGEGKTVLVMGAAGGVGSFLRPGSRCGGRERDRSRAS
jgi:NADPH:quinone reductase-like Zn-dependent oxidoreductase